MKILPLIIVASDDHTLRVLQVALHTQLINSPIQLVCKTLEEANLQQEYFSDYRLVLNIDDLPSIHYARANGSEQVLFYKTIPPLHNGSTKAGVLILQTIDLPGAISLKQVPPSLKKYPAFKLPDKIVLVTSDEHHIVPLSDILYCRAEDNYTHFHFNNRPQLIVSKPLREYEEQLAGSNFFRIHKSYLINLQALDKIIKKNGDFVIMTNGDKLPLSLRKKTGFLQFIKAGF